MFLVKLTKLAAAACVLGAVTVGVVAVPGVGADPTPSSKPAGKQKEPPPAAKEEPKPKSEALPDAERIRGTWVVVEVPHRAGDDADKKQLVGQSMTFDSGRLTTNLFPGRTKTYRLDPGWDPKRLDFTLRDGLGGDPSLIEAIADVPKEIIVPAIYRFDGDRLHLVVGTSRRKDRPESFEGPAARDAGFTHVVLRRGPAADRKDPERQALEGTWVSVAIEAGGVRQASSGSKLEFRGDRLLIHSQGATPPLEAEYTVDPKPAPPHIDLTVLTDRNDLRIGQTLKGLYRLNGNLLTLIVGKPNEERPKTLTDTNRATIYYQRDGTDAKLPPGGVSPRLRKLQQERVKALEDQIQGQFERVKIGKDPLIQFIEAVRELGEAELDLAQTRDQKIAAMERMLKRLVELEKQMTELQEVGLQTKQGVAQAKAARLKAEIQLEKLKAEK